MSYNAYGELISEANLKTLTRHYDELGRNVGWTLDGSRKNIIQYDNVTGRLYRMQAGGAWFTWGYLPGTNLKSSLTYGASGNTTWEYEPNRDLLTRVKNTIYGSVASQYDYTNDLGGRRTQIAKSGSMMAEDEVQDYGYNTRDELISGQGLTYNYDDIGNRTTAEGKTYIANNLNQYTAIDTFEPQYDADGNQTLIKTSTGIWAVTYNAENRPVRWERGSTVVTMNFDRMGRRVFYKEEVDGVVTKHHKFVYDNYLCVQKVDALNNNAQINLFVWDPTESVATRPLFMLSNPGSYKFFYTFDGNKNVSELVHFETRNGIAAHYDYAPFGTVTRAVNTSAISARNFHLENPFRFSSEYHDDTLGLVYYNYRHYNPTDARWCGRDTLEELRVLNLYQMKECVNLLDLLGQDLLSPGAIHAAITNPKPKSASGPAPTDPGLLGLIPIYGPIREMEYYAYHGDMLNANIALTSLGLDFFGVGTAIKAVRGCRVMLKVSMSWTTIRRVYCNAMFIEKAGTNIHHWLFPHRLVKQGWSKAIVNNPLNLVPISEQKGLWVSGKAYGLTSAQVHTLLHGKTCRALEIKFNSWERVKYGFMYGTPTYVKTVGARGLNHFLLNTPLLELEEEVDGAGTVEIFLQRQP